jgi:hypothetical protein
VLSIIAEPHEHRDDRSCWPTVAAIAARIAGRQPTRSEVESVRRACKHLAAAGDAEVWWRDELVPTTDPRVWAGRRVIRGHLIVHVPVSVEKAAHESPSQHIAPERVPCEMCRRDIGEIGGLIRVQGMSICDECSAGVTDAIGAISGEYALGLGPVVPCADCGGELSIQGYRRLYVNGATLPLCEACYREHNRASLARRGLDVDAIIAKLQETA